MSEKPPKYDYSNGTLVWCGAALCIWAFIAWWLGAEIYADVASESGERKAERARNLAFLIVPWIGAPFVVWRAWIADGQRKAAADQALTANEQVERARDRDYADLFTKAVEQLGATREVRDWDEETNRDVYRHEPNIEVRLGAIYALERIGAESERDHIAALETMCAYVRENARSRDEREGWQQGTEYDLFLLRNDVRAALISLSEFAQSQKFKKLRYQRGFDFNLRGVDFRDCVFGRRWFKGLRLIDTDFTGSRLHQVDFSNCDLRNVNFSNCALTGATFENANLCAADFSDAEGLTEIALDGSFGSSDTLLPSYATNWRPNDWVKDSIGYYRAGELFRIWSGRPNRVAATRAK